MGKRGLILPVAVGVRLDERTRAVLDEAARERGLHPTTLARELIARGLDVIDDRSPIRRRGSPVRDAELMRAALEELGRVGGNLQRTYVTLSAGGRADSDLVAIKAALRTIADQMLASLRPGSA